MSQTLTIIALAALIIAILLLFVYFKAESAGIAKNSNRRPIPGKYFILILITCTFLGMAITEWQGVCSLSPWGFITGILLGLAAETMAYLHSKRENAGGSG
jgi:hypothetical protein